MQVATKPAEPATRKSARELILDYFREFKVLRETRKEYWGIQIVNLLDCTCYFALLTIAPLFLSHDIGLNDIQAGKSVTLFTSATGLLLFVSGMYTDWLGIRKSLAISLGCMFVLRLAVVVVGLTPTLPYRGTIATGLLFLMAPFMAGIQTVFQASCQRYTTKKSRGAGFNLWYLAMNIGAAAAGFSIDIIRKGMGLPSVHIFSLGAILALLCLGVQVAMIKTEEQLVSGDEPVDKSQEEKKVRRKPPLQALREVFREPTIWRLFVLIALIIGVRAVYTYLYLLMPKYWERTIGPDAAIGTLTAINPVGIVFGLILFIPIANKFKTFDMLIFGAIISSFSLFPFALPWRWFSSNISHAHYIMAFTSMVILTIGEVSWSPKLYEYTAAIAPKGQEGVYLGLSLVPWFFAKTVVSYFSGNLLRSFSPEKYPTAGGMVPLQEAMVHNQVPYWHSPAAMWLLLGAYALAGCIGTLILRSWLTRGTEKKKDDTENSKDW